MGIKYRTGQGTSASDFTDLVVKVGDTLPIGTEVDYDGQSVPAGWQEVDETNLGDVVVDSIRTKNLLDTAKFVAGSSSVSILDAKNGTLEIQSTNGYYSQANQTISLKANTTYTISYNGVAEQTGSAVVCAIRNLADTATIARQEGAGDKTLTFTTTENGVIIRFMVTAETNTGKTKYTNIQLEEGSTATPYTPHQELDNQEVYSTGETRIGTWINGKPLYRKVLNFGALPNASEKSVSHNIANLKDIIKLSAISKSTSVYFPIPLGSSASLSANIYMIATNTDITIGAGSDRSGFTQTYVIIEYTKTTD